MAALDQLDILRQGVSSWNKWRDEEPNVTPVLRGADLRGADLRMVDLRKADLGMADLRGADLRWAYLSGARLREANLRTAYLADAVLPGAGLSGAYLTGADLRRSSLDEVILTRAHMARADLTGASLRSAVGRGADLRGAYMEGADLYRAFLPQANLSGAHLSQADLSLADLTGAKLIGADLAQARLVETVVEGCDLSQAKVYGVAAWSLRGSPTSQRDLVMTRRDEPVVTVDDLEVAQFMYLILHNTKIRRVIDTITSRVVLILGRFTPERKGVLDCLRDELRHHNLTPVLFDFDAPSDRDLTETVTLLARMARFVIADLTEPRSIPQELQAFVPDVAVPVQPIISSSQEPWSMFPSLRKYDWMLEPYPYDSIQDLLANLQTRVIKPADDKRKKLAEGA